MDEVLLRVRAMAHVECKNLNEKMSVYSQWSDNFEADVATLKYSAHLEAVKSLGGIVENHSNVTKSCTVIDFAAGTGLVAKCLREHGFTGAIDAQDGSEGMLRLGAHLYRNTYCCVLEKDAKLPGELTSSLYDVGIITGALSSSQVEVDCVELMLSAVRAGGYLILTTRLNPSNLEYVDRLEREMKRLEKQGACIGVERRKVEDFELATDETEKVSDSSYIPGVVYCYKKL